MFHILLDYGSEYIENLLVKEDMARNTLMVIDFSVDEKVKLREEFDISEEGKKCIASKVLEGETRPQQLL